MHPPLSKKCNLIFILISFAIGAFGQPVSFSPDYYSLNSVSGFTAYADCGVDMNGDFLDDVVRVGGKGILIDFQQIDGSYIQQFFPLPIQSLPGWSVCAGDIDNNGFNDLLFANSSTVSFIKVNNTGTSYAESLMPDTIFSQRSTMADIDNDGWLDAFVCHDEGRSVPFRNDGTGNMSSDHTLINTANLPGNYAAIWTDYDNDQDIDLYISKCLAGAPPGDVVRTNLLYQNDGNGTYTEVAAAVGLDDNSQSWSTVFEDFDNDGDFDAFIVNHDNQNLLFKNNGDGTFTDVTANSGIEPFDFGAWENASGDFNNDGFVDIFSELTHELYLGHGDLTFSGQSSPVKPGAIGDFNNDGFLDVVRNGQLWVNEGNADNHWIKVNPFGLVSNRNGIGARVEIYGAWGMQSREVRSGQSFSPMSSLTVHFGLGQYTQVDSLKIKWPSGISTTLHDLTGDSTYLVPEAACLLPFTFLENDGHELCPGDSIQLETPMGFAQYLWSNGSTDAAIQVAHPGRYFAVLTDANGCVSFSDFIDIKVAEEVPPTIAVSPANQVCEGDTVVLSIVAGQNPIWSNGNEGQSINVTESGSYTVKTDAKCTSGQLESLPYEVNILPSPAPFATDAIIGQGDSILLFADGENCHWYDAEMGGNLLHVGCEFQTPVLAANEVYYVESHPLFSGEIQLGGKMDTIGEGGISAQTGFLYFEAWQPFTLLSVKVYLPPGSSEGVRFIQLFSPDTLLAVKQFYVETGWNVLELGFDVPIGQLSLHCPLGNLFRNTEPLNYPYPIGEVGQITSSSFGKNFYYYFYDWQIRTQDAECISERVPVEITVTGTAETDPQNNIEIFPNPTDGQLFIKMKNTPAQGDLLRLFDANGLEVLRQEVGSTSSFFFNLNDYAAGIYMIQIGQRGQVFSQRIVVL